MTIKVLVFDFDGLLIDTETPDYLSWRELYAEYGCTLSLSRWAECVGAEDTFSPYDYLEELLGHPVDREAVRLRRRTRYEELMARQTLRPGVQDLLRQARQRELCCAIASNAKRERILTCLARFGVAEVFGAICSGEQVARTKPAPDLYLLVLQTLGVGAGEAVALEDSPNGVLAAKQAGLRCVAVPNPLTAQLDLSLADLQVASLADVSLVDLIGRW